MTEKVVLICLRGMPVILAVLVFVGIMMFGREVWEKQILKVYEEFGGLLAVKSRESGWFLKTQGFLLKKGAEFHFGKWLHPAGWLALCVMSGCACFLLGLQVNLFLALLCGPGGLFLPVGLLCFLNHRDNERMLPEIKLIYNGLELQLQAGVYVTDALTECLGAVSEIRLSEALLELAGAITVKADVYEALNRFQSRFDNRYIDALCITLIQALESGQAVDLLKDIAEQVKDMELLVMGRRKAALDRSVTFYQLGILAALLGVVIYACVSQMFAVAVGF